MKTTLFNIILTSWLLILVESFSYSPVDISIRDELPYQPFIPSFIGYTSKDGFYRAIRSYPANNEYPPTDYPAHNEYHTDYPAHSEYPTGHPAHNGYSTEYPAHSGYPTGHPSRPGYHGYKKKGPCSGTGSAVKHAFKFCRDVMIRLEELRDALQGCERVEIPLGTRCGQDNKCYVISEYYSTATNTIYAAYHKACPCPQKHFVPDLTNPLDVDDYLNCLGQEDTENGVVLTVGPDPDKCTYLHYNSGTATHVSTPGVCSPDDRIYLFVCEVPCP